MLKRLMWQMPAQEATCLSTWCHAGSELENLIKNPTLSGLLGGIESVTLGDEEARRRGVQKSVLERAGPPTFDVAVGSQAASESHIRASAAQ